MLRSVGRPMNLEDYPLREYPSRDTINRIRIQVAEGPASVVASHCQDEMSIEDRWCVRSAPHKTSSHGQDQTMETACAPHCLDEGVEMVYSSDLVGLDTVGSLAL